MNPHPCLTPQCSAGGEPCANCTRPRPVRRIPCSTCGRMIPAPAHYCAAAGLACEGRPRDTITLTVEDIDAMTPAQAKALREAMEPWVMEAALTLNKVPRDHDDGARMAWDCGALLWAYSFLHEHATGTGAYAPDTGEGDPEVRSVEIVRERVYLHRFGVRD